MHTSTARAVPTALKLLSTGLLAATPLLAACGGDDGDDSTDDTTETTETSEPEATAPDDTADAPEEEAAATEKVNANTASEDEMVAAFEAAGVENAEQWAHEVEEYRPYEDDGWAKLRDELSKYNIDDETFNKITSVLEL